MIFLELDRKCTEKSVYGGFIAGLCLEALQSSWMITLLNHAFPRFKREDLIKIHEISSVAKTVKWFHIFLLEQIRHQRGYLFILELT